jgi:amidase
VRNPATQSDLAAEQMIAAAFDTISNTCQFDISGHPAMSVPCGLRDGLPVGMMLVGRYFDEATIYRAAHAFEQERDWRSR